jgi:hypothetical protein
MSVAFCLCFASLAPRPLFLFALAGFLFMAAIASMALAGLQRHEPLAPYLTAWDEASWSLTLSLGLRLLLGPAPAG